MKEYTVPVVVTKTYLVKVNAETLGGALGLASTLRLHEIEHRGLEKVEIEAVASLKGVVMDAKKPVVSPLPFETMTTPVIMCPCGKAAFVMVNGQALCVKCAGAVIGDGKFER